jgi:predicted nucleic acid-binding Zn ribbon protein
MLQILIWATCVLIVGVGYCGWQLEELLAYKKQAKKTTGMAWFAFMVLAAILLAVISILQAQGIADLVK